MTNEQILQKHWTMTKDFMINVTDWAAKSSTPQTTTDDLTTINEIEQMIVSSDYTKATSKHIDLLNFIYNVRRLADIDKSNIKMSTVETIMQAVYHNLINGGKLGAKEEKQEQSQQTEEMQGEDNMRELTQATEEMVRSVSQEVYLVSEEDVEDLVVSIERNKKLDPKQADIVEGLIYSASTNHECFPDKGFDAVADELKSVLI